MTEGHRIVDAAFALAEREGWRRVGPRAVAAELGVDAAEVRRLSPCRAGFLHLGLRRGVRALAAPLDVETVAAPPRDRLFEVLMRRYDALKPLRPGLAALSRRDGDPSLAAMALAALPGTARAAMDGAELCTFDPLAIARVGALAALLVGVDRAFGTDEGEDLATTMAALDQALTRAQGWAARFAAS